MLPFADVNLLAVLGATIAAMVLGMIWYGPLFGEKWMKLVGLSKKDAEKDMGKTMLMGFVHAFLAVYSLALVLLLVTPANLHEGMVVGALVWFGFTALNEAGAAIWARSSWELAFINSGYSLVNILIAVAILMHWA